MRKIKFRGYDKELDSFIYGDLLHIGDYLRIENENDMCYVEVAEQFTGLTDKNGVDIYEGDIITYGVHNGLYEESLKGCVYYNETSACFMIKFDEEFEIFTDGRLEYILEPTELEYVPNFGEKAIKFKNVCEVIGNIHEGEV